MLRYWVLVATRYRIFKKLQSLPSESTKQMTWNVFYWDIQRSVLSWKNSVLTWWKPFFLMHLIIDEIVSFSFVISSEFRTARLLAWILPKAHASLANTIFGATSRLTFCLLLVFLKLTFLYGNYLWQMQNYLMYYLNHINADDYHNWQAQARSPYLI